MLKAHVPIERIQEIMGDKIEVKNIAKSILTKRRSEKKQENITEEMDQEIGLQLIKSKSVVDDDIYFNVIFSALTEEAEE